MDIKCSSYSNTTLVKVKLSIGGGIVKLYGFKYNSC